MAKTAEELEAERAAEAAKTGNNGSTTDGSKNTETMIPKYRFDEVLEKQRKLEKDLEQFQKQKEIDDTKRMEEQQQWKELAEKRGRELEAMKIKADKAEKLAGKFESLFESEVKGLSDDDLALLPEALPVEDRYDLAIKLKRRLQKSPPPNTDTGTQGSQDRDQTAKAELTPEEVAAAKSFGMTAEEYKSAK